MEAVEKWLARAEPDVLLMQETKLGRRRRAGDAVPDAGLRAGPPRRGALERRRDPDPGRRRGRHHELRRRPGARLDRGLRSPVRRGRLRPVRRGADGVRGRAAGSGSSACTRRTAGSSDSPFYEGKLRWFERVGRWLAETRTPDEPLLLGGDYNVTPAPEDVWSEAKAHGGTHVSPTGARGAGHACATGASWTPTASVRPEPGRFSWWDYRAGMFHRNEGMRIDLLYATAPVAERVVWAEIDREARKGPPTPSDHAPVVVDLDEPGKAFDAGWEGALERIAARTKPRR